MALLPADVPQGLVTAQFFFANEDSMDADRDPELSPVTGLVTFTANAKVLRMPQRKASVIPLVFQGRFDAQGNLIPVGTTDIGMRLPATNSTQINPRNYTWHVDFDLVYTGTQETVNIPAFDFSVPEGAGLPDTGIEAIDLTVVMPADQSPGVITIQGPKGDDGDVGPANTLSIGTVETLEGTPLDDDIVAEQILLGSATPAALGGIIAGSQQDFSSGGYLDIWSAEAFPATYAEWITKIDSELAGKTVKRTVGKDSYNQDVTMHEAGSGSRRVLLTTGIHPGEMLSQIAAKQFFTQFAKSEHPSMVALRQQVTVFFIPCVMPGGFRVNRENANGVNINRNFNLNHASSTDPYKGAAPFDQPEAALLKNVIDTYKPSLTIDCHNFGTTGQSDFAFGSPRITHGKPGTVYKAVETWKKANPDFTGVMKRLDDSNRDATYNNWAQKYIRFDKGDSSAMSLLVECIATLGGSTLENGSRQGIRQYASFVYQGILAWLESGQMDEVPLVSTTHAVHSISGGFDTTAQAGGRIISSLEWVPITFATSSTLSNSQFLEAPLPYPGRFRIVGSVNLVRTGSNTDPVRVDIGISIKSRFGEAAATGPIASTVRSVQIGQSQTVSVSTEFLTSLYSTLPAENIYAVQLWVRTTADQNVRITSNNMVSGAGGGARLIATAEPSFEPFIQPFNGF